ncbi:Nn.00g050610.m01.CDS01 [Neocucurbitaria sp. VM-36]
MATNPVALTEQPCDPYIFDTSHFENLLAENSKRTLVPDEELQIKLIEVGARDWIFTNLIDWNNYLQTEQFKGTRIILIPQRYSWDRLTISENALRRLLGHFNILPAFIDVICAFGKLTSETSDSLGGCYSWKRGNISELCYLLKNVEKHGREGSEEPWSIRQLGVYHQHDSASRNDTFIILNPMVSFQQRLKDARARTELLPTWRDIHNLALSHSTWQWRWYLTFWESKLTELISKAHVSRVEGRRKFEKLPVLTIEYSDFQDVQVIHDRMNAAKYILSSNISICAKTKGKLREDSNVDLFLEELKLQSTRVDNLLERARSGSGLMQDIISFRGLDSLKTSSENSNEMARLADIDSKNMVKLTTKSQRDASTLKKVTWLTSIYLPASFVSQFLSMGYLNVNSKTSPASLNFASELWIFVVLTVLLLSITFGGWLCLDTSREGRWWRRRGRQNQAVGEKV